VLVISTLLNIAYFAPIIIAAFFTIIYQSVSDALVIEFGFRDVQLGVFYAGVFIVSALGVQLTPWLKKRLKPYQIITIIGAVFSVTLMMSPFVMMFVGGLTIYLRGTLGQFLINLTSNEINRGIPSKFRTTALSTFSMLKSLPYMFFAILIGHLMDLYTARIFAFWFGFFFGVIILVQFLFYRKTTQKR
jgi:MFS family permease